MGKSIVSRRSFDLKRVHHLYERHQPYGPDTCVYCGEPATSEDHIAPIGYVATLLDVVDIRHHPINRALLIVPSCSDCNARASDTLAYSVSEKREMIHKRLRRKHRRLLGSYDWQDEELEEFGHSLREYIKAQENKRLWLLQRLGWPRNARHR